MKHQLRVEVEPLGDQRWTKIERSLMARVEDELPSRQHYAGPHHAGQRSGVGRAWLAAAALVGVLAAWVLTIRWTPEPVAVDHPSRITTGASATHLALPGLTLDVEPESAVVLSSESTQGVLLVLDRGSIVCEVAPRSNDAPLIVQAGAARVRVVGTRFSVTRSGESARVAVYHGVVEVTSEGQTRRVGAGEQWPARVTEPPSAEPVEPLAEPQPASASGSTTARAAPSGAAHDPVAPPSRTPTVVAPKPSKATANTPVGTAPSSDAADRPAASGAEPAPRPSSQAVFEQATALERSDPERAFRLYRSLESGTDPWAQNALYARGRLAASRGNRSEARRLLHWYLERFPRGSNAADARAVLERLE